LARLSASGMSLSASLVKSFSGFSRPDMMANEVRSWSVDLKRVGCYGNSGFIDTRLLGMSM
jgi:hypothetical protein